MEDKTTKTTLTLYCGLAGAGKSTHAREYATKSNARYISLTRSMKLASATQKFTPTNLKYG